MGGRGGLCVVGGMVVGMSRRRWRRAEPTTYLQQEYAGARLGVRDDDDATRGRCRDCHRLGVGVNCGAAALRATEDQSRNRWCVTCPPRAPWTSPSSRTCGGHRALVLAVSKTDTIDLKRQDRAAVSLPRRRHGAAPTLLPAPRTAHGGARADRGDASGAGPTPRRSHRKKFLVVGRRNLATGSRRRPRP